jgi:hypothetical protein
MSKSTSKERIMIVDSISRRPYGVKLSVLLDDSTRMMLHGKACLLTDTDYIINVRPIQSRVTGQADTVPGFRAWEIFVEGFATAGEAEKKGLEIAFGILWGAISERYSVRLQYQTPLPCVVYDRTRQGSGSLAVSTSATFILGKSLASIATAINEGLSSQERGNEKLLLAMELFASARQESHIEASLSGRIANLSTESVSSAIRRVVKETLPDDSEALRIIEDAYNLRSRILHDGTTDADLNQKSREVETVVRRVIASRAALNLRVS